MKRAWSSLFRAGGWLAVGWLVCGCHTVRPLPGTEPRSEGWLSLDARVATNAPIHPEPFGLGQKLNPVWWLGNADEPTPPEWYRPDSRRRNFQWQLRNPCHNFTFYVLGVADQKFTRTGSAPEAVFQPAGGWNWTVTHTRWRCLPFVSYQCGGFKFYLGWRERGNFGIKLTFARESAPPQPVEKADPPVAR